jgi:tetratricopeptide (TPR) repeat protein
LSRILVSYPNGFHADRAVLLTGQKIGEKDPAAARRLFEAFAAQAPNARLLPEVRLAIARTYEQQDNWPAAIKEYESWLAVYTNQPTFLPRALYYSALANFRDCRATNALALFTNFVERFPNDPLAPLAQMQAADDLFTAGRFEEAESRYQLCFRNTNCPALLSYQAQMMAGRAALARLVWKDATQYFTNLTSDLKCPPEIWGQAMFAYGDTLMGQDSTNRKADLQTAVAVFNAICDRFPNQPQAVLAWGQKAKCLLQLAYTATDYEPVTNAFQQVLNSAAADAATRSIAQVGLGLTLEKIGEQKPESEQMAYFEAALDHYLSVFITPKLLRPGEQPDPFWTRKAGLEAARLLAEKLKRRTEAINILQQLQEMFPPLHLEDRINALKAQEQDSSQRS